MTEWERDGRQRWQISEPLILNPVTGLHCLVSSSGASIWREMSLQLWQMCEMPLSVYDGAADVWECLVHMIMVLFLWWKKNPNWLEIIKHTKSLLISAYWKQKKKKRKSLFAEEFTTEKFVVTTYEFLQCSSECLRILMAQCVLRDI